MVEEMPVCTHYAVSKVAQLRPGQAANVICKVVSGVVAAYKTQADGSTIRVIEAEVGDETGRTRARFLNTQCDFARIHSTLIFRNARVSPANRLEVDAYGSIDVCALHIEVAEATT